MQEFHTYIIYAVFVVVILCIVFDLIDMVLASMLGLCILVLLGTIEQKDILSAVTASEGSLSLLFGGMVVARVLAPTGIFDHLGTRFLILTRGSGRRFLILLTILVSVVCSILPNATTVILLAPLVLRVCDELKIDFTGPMILVAIASNSAGLLTLVGDPATFLVGQSIGLGFVMYLKTVSLGGVLCIVALILLMPILFPHIWRCRQTLAAGLRPGRIKQPYFCGLALFALGVMVALFLFGEVMPNPIAPPAAAIIGASLALLAIYSARVAPVDHVFRDIDWKTILFIFSMMIYIELITKTGLMGNLSKILYAGAGDNLLFAGCLLLSIIGLASGFLANIPVVAASILMVKGYLVLLQLVPEEALGLKYAHWPDSTLPVFVAMMFGGTLGGNSTLIGASANLVSAGICAERGKRISFVTFSRYGLPVTACQMLVAGVYVWLKFFVL